MARSTWAKLAITLGSLLLFVSAVLFTNGYFCIFNKASCGMVEPLIALPMALLGACLVVVGLFGIRHARL